MGLVSEAIATELGYLTRDEGVARVRLTLETLLTHWPRDSHSGFMVHFTNRNWDSLSEFSTIDTTELVLGALFAGTYVPKSSNYRGSSFSAILIDFHKKSL